MASNGLGFREGERLGGVFTLEHHKRVMIQERGEQTSNKVNQTKSNAMQQFYKRTKMTCMKCNMMITTKEEKLPIQN